MVGEANAPAMHSLEREKEMNRFLQAIDQFNMPVVGSLAQPGMTNAMVFTATGVKQQGVPPGAILVLIDTGGADAYVSFGGTAAVPGGDITDGSASPRAAGLWILDGVSTISIAVGEAAIVTLAYYG